MTENVQKFPKQFLGPSYSSRVARADAERTVNMYIEINPLQTAANDEMSTLIGMPGLTLITNLGTNPIRGLYTTQDTSTAYAVTGNQLYRIYSTNLSTPTLVGTLATSSGPVNFADNGINVLLVDGQYGYVTSLITSPAITLGTFISAGLTYVNGTYNNFPLSGGNGTGLTVNLVVTGHAIVSCTLANPGTGYQVGDVLNANSLGDTAFTIKVATCPLSVTTITNPNFYPASTVAFQDGYFICNQVGTPYFFISDLYNTNFLPLNEANKSGAVDNIQGLVVLNRILYLIGQNTAETWWDSGQSGSTPFTRQDGQFNQVGCVASQTIQKLFNTFIWLGRSPEGGGVVYQMQNSQATRISNHAVEYAIQTLPGDISTAKAYTWQTEGHYFYALNLPGSTTTWVYDLDSQIWVEQQTNIAGVMGRHLVDNHCYFANAHLVGDYSTGNIYKYDYTNYTDNGNPIVRIRQAPHITDSMKWIFYKVFQIDFTPGTGNSLQSNPQVMLNWSDDGGETWSAPLYAAIGAQGAFTTRARWSRLGKSRDRIFRVTCSDPVKFDIVSAMMDIEEGNA